MRYPRCFAALAAALLAVPVAAGDWANWRGPEYNGHSKEVNLPAEWSPDKPGEDNLIWKQPYGSRSAPIVLDGRLYLIQGYGQGVKTGERVVCLDAESGELLWKHEFGVYHTDVVFSRLGWCSPCGDPKTGYVYVHGTQGELICFDKDGTVVWDRQLTEEFGRVTGYGGRISNPVVIEDLVILGIVNGSWGNQARGWNRFIAFDTKTGEVAWWNQTPQPVPGTYYSNPVPAVINGQFLMITGGSDGGVHAFQARTGKNVWSYQIAGGIVNGSPIVDSEGRVYITHGEDNVGSSRRGKVVCLDAANLDDNGKPALVWQYDRGKLFGLASAALADGKLYCPDDFATLFCFDAEGGELLWRANYGRVARGSPLIADNKLYIFDVNATFLIYELDGEEEPEEVHSQKFVNREVAGFVETNSTPIAVNGKLYLTTADAIYCVGLTDKEHPEPEYDPLPDEADGGEEVAQVLLYPAEVTMHPGDSCEFEVRFFNKLGQRLGSDATGDKPEFSLPTPPKGPGPQEPALEGEIDGTKVTVSADVPTQQGYVKVQVGDISAMARVRVAPKPPYKEDFEAYPVGGVPGGYVYAQGKFLIKEFEGGKVLMKTNTATSPPLARANAYLTTPDVAGYTIAADVRATLVRGLLPDAGVVNSRYNLILDGKPDLSTGKRSLRISSWDAMPRINKPIEFDWQPDTWYRMKLRVDVEGEKAQIRGKVWERDSDEPEEWTIEFEDPLPNTEGAAALYGFVTNTLAEPSAPNFEGSELYFDNVEIVPHND